MPDVTLIAIKPVIHEPTVAKKITILEQEEDKKNQDFGWFDLVKLCTAGLQKLTGKEIAVERRMNEKGEIIAYSVSTDFMEISGTTEK